MSRQAQAERERQARIILGTAETEISSKFAQAAGVYKDNPVALHLRAMNMLYEAIKEKGSMVIVPSSAVETMGLGGSWRLLRWRTESSDRLPVYIVRVMTFVRVRGLSGSRPFCAARHAEKSCAGMM